MPEEGRPAAAAAAGDDDGHATNSEGAGKKKARSRAFFDRAREARKARKADAQVSKEDAEPAKKTAKESPVKETGKERGKAGSNEGSNVSAEGAKKNHASRRGRKTRPGPPPCAKTSAEGERQAPGAEATPAEPAPLDEPVAKPDYVPPKVKRVPIARKPIQRRRSSFLCQDTVTAEFDKIQLLEGSSMQVSPSGQGGDWMEVVEFSNDAAEASSKNEPLHFVERRASTGMVVGLDGDCNIDTLRGWAFVGQQIGLRNVDALLRVPNLTMSPSLDVRDVFDSIDATIEGSQRVVLVGKCWGGNHVLGYAAANSASVVGVVLVQPSGPPPILDVDSIHCPVFIIWGDQDIVCEIDDEDGGLEQYVAALEEANVATHAAVVAGGDHTLESLFADGMDTLVRTKAFVCSSLLLGGHRAKDAVATKRLSIELPSFLANQLVDGDDTSVERSKAWVRGGMLMSSE